MTTSGIRPPFCLGYHMTCSEIWVALTNVGYLLPGLTHPGCVFPVPGWITTNSALLWWVKSYRVPSVFWDIAANVLSLYYIKYVIWNGSFPSSLPQLQQSIHTWACFDYLSWPVLSSVQVIGKIITYSNNSNLMKPMLARCYYAHIRKHGILNTMVLLMF